mgnify:CR=1 FL=1
MTEIEKAQHVIDYWTKKIDGCKNVYNYMPYANECLKDAQSWLDRLKGEKCPQ